jgi:N-acetyl-anhydromuramyl-L-alanine amidase AmpD
MQIEVFPSPNGTVRVAPISALVLHYTNTMTLDAALRWYSDPQTHDSVHYVVGRDGRLVQMVEERNVAWHAGRSSMHPQHPKHDPRREPNVNAFSIGIALVGCADSGFTDRQLAALYQLVELLVVRYKILPDRVVGHRHIVEGNRRDDPDGYDNQFPWGKLQEVANRSYLAALQKPQP